MRYFVWLLAFVNLMNGTGYLMASALTNSGDWAVVIAGLKPALAWRAALGALGVVTFAASVRWATGVMREWVAHADVALADVARLTWVPYLAGGLMFALASVFNPVGPAMILTSGVAASLGLTFGLLIVAGGSFSPPVRPSEALPLQRSWSWIVVGLVVAALFIGVLGPGVHF